MTQAPALDKVEINKDEVIASALQLEEVTETKPQIKYNSIIRHGKSGTHETISDDAEIIIQEKLDGSNASFKIENGFIRVFSRNQELDEHNTLSGFYNWVMEYIDSEKLLPYFVYFGEWLSKNKIDYGEKHLKQFYLFDVYSELDDEYCDFEDVQGESEALGVKLVPVHYIGRAKGFEHLQSFVGKSLLNPEVDAEGIVVKNVKFKKRDGSQVFTKIVSNEYAEMVKQPLARAPKPPTEERIFVDTFLTPARVEKHLHKLLDEGIVDELAIENMKAILQNVGGRIYQDMLDEEADELPETFEEKLIKGAIGKALPIYVKEILSKIGGM